RFIVKRHKEIKDRLRWRTGVVLAHSQLDAEAVVRADNEARQIHITVTGKERKVYLALIWLTFRELHTGFEGLKVDERIPMPDHPDITEDYETLLNYAEQGLEKIIPKGTKKAYSVKELLEGVHFDSQSQGERMLVLAKDDEEKGRLKSVVKSANKYLELKPNFFGIGGNFNAFFDDILNKKKK
ncbi:MAG: hypothetical protein D3914_06210, partial [Candidatus Electrothrix sp. LOE2]|nr:hypothetical protein [Candidatus Electrothrix sp. LOE2]